MEAAAKDANLEFPYTVPESLRYRKVGEAFECDGVPGGNLRC